MVSALLIDGARGAAGGGLSPRAAAAGGAVVPAPVVAAFGEGVARCLLLAGGPFPFFFLPFLGESSWERPSSASSHAILGVEFYKTAGGEWKCERVHKDRHGKTVVLGGIVCCLVPCHLWGKLCTG